MTTPDSQSQTLTPPPPKTIEEEVMEGAAIPGFGPPRHPPGPRPADPLDPEVTTVHDPAADSFAEEEFLRAETPGSSRASTDPLGVVTGDPEAFKPITDLLVDLAGLAAHNRLAPGDNPLWYADDQDHEMIAEPLARLAARHAPISAGPASDITDAIQAFVGVAGYTMKNVRRRREMEAYFQQQAQNAAAESA